MNILTKSHQGETTMTQEIYCLSDYNWDQGNSWSTLL